MKLSWYETRVCLILTVLYSGKKIAVEKEIMVMQKDLFVTAMQFQTSGLANSDDNSPIRAARLVPLSPTTF